MKQQNLTFLLTLLLSMMSVHSSAQDIEVTNADGITIYYNWINNKTELEVTYQRGSYSNKYSGRVIIPESVTYNGDTYPVTSIGANAFLECTGLTSIDIPNSVTKLGSSAFCGCTGLQSVVVGNGVTKFPYYVFGTGNRLESLTIGTGLLSIDSNAFYSPYSFTNDKPIKTIWLTNTPPTKYTVAEGAVNYVANELYTYLNNKTVYPFLSSIFEVDGVKYVPVSPSERTCDAIDCLYDDKAENINIGETVSYKGVEMKVQRVHKYACYGNSFIKNVETSFNGDIEDYAFYGISGDYTASINNRGNIGQSAFADSKGLKALEIGSNVTNIENSVFKGCSTLTAAKLQSKGTVGENAFQGCTSMMTASLGERITSIGQYAFDGCSKLERIMIPNAVFSIGAYAFQNCASMKTAKIGIGVQEISTYTFSGCSSLQDIEIGNNVKTIDTYAFSDCKALPVIRIPRAVTNIKDYVFRGCSSLKTVIMGEQESELTLGSNGSNPLFSSCPLDSVFIGRNITYPTASNKGYSPFYRNTSLRSVEITDKETEVSVNEFYGCTNLKNVKIGNGVTTIGDWAFSGCSSIDYFSFGSSVKSIGKEAFSDCTAMTKLISYAATPPTCGSQALDDINKWGCVLSVPQGYKAAYQQADQWKEFFFIEDTVDGINDIAVEENEVKDVYNLNGSRINQMQQGLNIIRTKDGKTQKIWVK